MAEAVKPPTTAEGLEKLARERLKKLCNEYRENYTPLKPVELSMKERTKINEWLKLHGFGVEKDFSRSKQELKDWLQKEDSDNKNLRLENADDKLLIRWAIDSKMKIQIEGPTKTITTTTPKVKFEKEIKKLKDLLDDFSNNDLTSTKEQDTPYDPAKYLWLENLPNKEEMKSRWKKIQDSAREMFDKLDKWLAAVEDIKAMNEKGTENYEFRKPEPEHCKANLFEKRKFYGMEFKERNENQVRVMQWNILADGLSGAGLSVDGYQKSLKKQFSSPKECLTWEYRKWLILEEIAHYEADIITLVELDGNQNCFDPKEGVQQEMRDQEDLLIYWLRPIGYEMRCLSRDVGPTNMGHGFFWKIDKFKVIDDDIQWTYLQKKQFFTLLRFNVKGNSHRNLAVCSLHLESAKDADGEEKRFKQIWEALYILNNMKYTNELADLWDRMHIGNGNSLKVPKLLKVREELEKVVSTFNLLKDYSVIITGDFNAERILSLSEEADIVLPRAVSAPYAAGFKSFYDEVYGKDLKWTSWKSRPAGRTDKYTLDYIFGSERTKGLGVLLGIPDYWVDENILFPNYWSGSDHISLVVDFELLEPVQSEYPDPRHLTDAPHQLSDVILGVVVAMVIVMLTMLGWRFLGPGSRGREKSPLASLVTDYK